MNPPSPIEVSVHLTMRDAFGEFFWIIFRRFGWTAIFIFSCIAIMMAMSASRPELADKNLISPAVIAGLTAWFLFLFVASPYLSARAMLKTSKALQGPIEYRFSENGFDTASSVTSAHVDWAALYKVRETRQALLLYFSKHALCIVPKRCFADAESLDALRQIIRTHVAGKVKLRQRNT